MLPITTYTKSKIKHICIFIQHKKCEKKTIQIYHLKENLKIYAATKCD